MRKNIYLWTIPVWGILVFVFATCSAPPATDCIMVESAPQLFPDYAAITLPPNLAPANFAIREEGDRFRVRIYGDAGEEIVLRLSGKNVCIPEKKWRNLLRENKGGKLSIAVASERDGRWYQYQTIENEISADAIDPYLYYRDVVPTNSLWNKMAMRRRNMESFREEKLIDNYRIGHNCMNCHTFNRNNAREFLFHVRGTNGGTVLYRDGKLSKIDFPFAQAAYGNWRPDGKLVAFAVNEIKQNYYLSGYGDKMKEVFDLQSDVVLYHTETNTILSFPQIASAERENLPAWSADGQTLYYVSAPPYRDNMANEEMLYSLMNVSYDMQNNRMGKPEQLLSPDEAGGSVSFPTPSPDGRYMFFCVADFGYFPVNNKSADLYIMDLATGAYRKPDINSDESESYVSWSSNSRWIVFSSRRLDGMTSKPFLCHVSPEGILSKPFILPQEDPDYYRTDHRNFSRPELIRNRVDIGFRKLRKAIYSTPATAAYQTEP